MEYTKFELQVQNDDEMYILLPLDFVGEGDPGEPLGDGLVRLLRFLATMGYWPVDLGEGDDHHVVLWLSRTDTPLGAVAQTEHFIKVGGDV